MSPRSFRSILAGFMATLVAVAILVVLAVSMFFFARSVMALVDDLAEEALGRVEDRLKSLLDQAVAVNEQTLLLMRGERVDPPGLLLLSRFFAKTLQVHKGLGYLGMGFEASGDYLVAERTPEGLVRVREYLRNETGEMEIRDWRWRSGERELLRVLPWDGFDPRKRDYYKLARSVGKSCWTKAYPFWRTGDDRPVLGVTYATPWFDQAGEFAGVIDADFDLRAVCAFLAELEADLPGYAIVAEDRADGIPRLIAHPREEAMPKVRGVVSAENLDDIDDEVAVAYFAALVNDRSTPPIQEIGRRFKVRGERYIGSYRRITGENVPGWIIGMLIPSSTVAVTARANLLWSLASGLCCLGVAVGLALWLSRKMARPLQALSEEARRIGQLDLGTSIARKSRIREMYELQQAIDETKASLRSFRKYVPADLVHDLIESGEEARLGGRKERLTVFFSDVRDFTTLSEPLKPEELVEHMGAYLEEISEVIHAYRGTLDKFIGDGVMAFWGAPRPNANHALDACRAAWTFQERLDRLCETWRARGRPLFHTRIGIHTGDVVVGNIGSESRMNYTVLGDAVNLASRMEGLNRDFGTRILISDDTRKASGAAVLVRPVARVVVKGRSHGVLAYELMGLEESEPPQPPDLGLRTEAAFRALEGRRFDEAERLYQEILSVYPDDGVAKLNVERCVRLRDLPTTSDSDTIFHARSK